MLPFELTDLLLVLDLLLLSEICKFLFHVGGGGSQLEFPLHLLNFLLVLLFLFPLNFFDLSDSSIMHISLLTFQLSLHISLHLINLFIILQLHLSLLSLQLINIDFLALQELILLLLKLFNFKIESFLLGFLHSFSYSLIILNQTLLLSLKFGAHLSIKLLYFLFALILYPSYLSFFLFFELILKTLNFNINILLNLIPDLSLLFFLIFVPFQFFPLCLFFVLPDQFLFF